MRAVVVRSLDGPDGLELSEVAEPGGSHPAADGARQLVVVHAAGVAVPDQLQSRGEYQLATPPPFVSGGEVAGVVREAPDGCGFAVGDRVAGMVIWGAMAELALAVPKYTVRIPDGMSYAEGAALWLNYSTAWFGIERAGVRSGETVLVQGAAGGVGTAALDLLRGIGARSIAVVSSDEKEQVARSMGADEVVRSSGAWLDEVRTLTGGLGVDVVLDPVGGEVYTRSLPTLNPLGSIVAIGFAGGLWQDPSVQWLVGRNASVFGFYLGRLMKLQPEHVRAR
ncbi:MAG: NADPH:quinone reductase, partial [Streptomyces sp.]|nr:NADPH:quinone reductase [Streptomyces sp.]